ncbi:sigma-70 family RNA polymerase sigma factor [Halovulum sp. GXIMD14794]
MIPPTNREFPPRAWCGTDTTSSNNRSLSSIIAHNVLNQRVGLRGRPGRIRTGRRGIVPGDAEAEDVVQETYLAAFTRLDRYEERARFSTWITRIAINNARMHLRRTRPAEEYDTVTEDRTRQIVAFPGSPPEGADSALGRAQARALLETAIAALPPELRLPFLLHEVEGMKLREIAQDLSINQVTLRTRMFRARRQLRAALTEKVSSGFEGVFPFDGARCARMADRGDRRAEGARKVEFVFYQIVSQRGRV